MTMTPAQPPPPPEALLIRIAREAAGLSPESAAAKMAMKFGGSRWRQIEAGYRKDTDSAVEAKPATLAHMAHAIGVTPARLAEAGREDAAEILREMERNEDVPATAPAEKESPLADLEDWQRQVILGVLDERPRSKKAKALLLQTIARELEREAELEGVRQDAQGSQPDTRSA